MFGNNFICRRISRERFALAIEAVVKREQAGDTRRIPYTFESIYDPARLAEVIEALLRKLGMADLSDHAHAPTNEARVRAFGDEIMICRRRSGRHKLGGPLLDMAATRALTVKLLACETADDALDLLEAP